MNTYKKDDEKLFRHVFSIDCGDLLTEEELYGTLRTMNDMYRANFLIHLSDQSYVVLKDLVEDSQMQTVYQSAQELMDASVRRKIKEEYMEEALAFVDLSTLAERMKDTDCIQYEYPNILNIWCVATFHVIERTNGVVSTVDFSVLRFTYDRAKTQDLLMMQKEAITMMSDSEVLYVSTINKENGDTRILQSPRTEIKNRNFDFDQSMQKEAKYIYEADRQAFRESIRLDALNEALERENPYTYSAFAMFPGDERIRRITYHFSCNKDFPHYILAATEDNTESFSRDAVTGMKNYNGFKLDCMYTFSRFHADKFAVLNFNLMNFKAVNAVYGHDAGNWLLKEVLLKIKESEIPFLSVCRENADNYFCLCRKRDCDYEAIRRLCEMTISGEDDFSEKVNLFCGIYPISNRQESLNEICDKARLARRYAEREIGSNIWTLDETENSKYLQEATTASAISKALQDGEIIAYYQPIYDAKSGEIASAEALVRWIHPEKGIISPAMFIPVIERSGQIVKVDLHVAKQVQELQKQRYTTGKHMVPISFNVSRYDFLQNEYLTKALQTMQAFPEIADMMRIEITETGMISIPGRGKAFLQEMKRLGIKTLIDDFGTGYSSLVTLSGRMSDMIKLDMVFARSVGIDERMEILIRAAIETAHYMGIQVIAEGVETKEQYEFLKEKGCDYIQGYYFSKPLPEDEFLKLLEEI